jgi:peptidoglycan/xylan/chitin deacetylase (PgdA/CDA1 family)
MSRIQILLLCVVLLTALLWAMSLPWGYYSGLWIFFGAFVFLMSMRLQSGFFVSAQVKTSSDNVMLTFDDGPDPELTPKVLDILAAEEVQAMFFLIGKKIKGNEALVRRIVEEGHLVGSHSFSHDPRMGFWGKVMVRNDIWRGHQSLQEVVPEAGQWYRPPFGVTNPNIAQAIRGCGLKVVGWSLRSTDTVIRDERRLLDRLRRKVRGGDVVLLHDTQAQTVAILPSFIHFLKERQLRIKAEL